MNLNETIASNVKYYRKQANLSQKELAEKCGFSKSLLEKLETGNTPFSRDHVNAVAFALSLPTAIFFQPFLTPERGYFRANRKMKDGVLILNRAARWVRDYYFLEQLLHQEKPFALTSLKIKDYSDDGISRFAGEIRTKLGLNDLEPIQNLCDLVEDSGIYLLLMDSPTDGFFGFSLLGPEDIPAIVVNTSEKITLERQIFSLAHELGHIMLHLSVFGPCHGIQGADDPEANEREREANLFAGAFLLPEKGFIQEWQRSLGLNFYERVIYVKKKFKVSYSAVLTRLVQLQIADNSVFPKFKKLYSQRNGQILKNNQEPEPLYDDTFIATRFRNLVFDALNREEITISRAAEMLQISVDDVLRISREDAE